MTERLLVIEHGSYAPAGLLAEWAADRALAVQTVALHAGEPLPASISGYAAAVYDAFDLPSGAAELGSNEVSLQGFSLGPHTGVQFHPEATQPIARSWVEITNPDPAAAGPLFRDADAIWEQAAGQAPKLFSAWLDGDLASR